MKRIASTFFIFLFLLSACAPAVTPAAPSSTPKPPTATARSTEAEAPSPTAKPSQTATPSPVPTPSRMAAISQVEPLVEARTSASLDFESASPGLSLPVGGEARTGENGRARIDLAPDGTIIRLAPDSHFSVMELEQADGSPFTLLELFFGKIFIILSGGELEVQSPSGVASVRGSMLSVAYDPSTNTMTATCLEGHCGLRNETGRVDLVAGQAADIRDGVLSREPRDLNEQEMLDWLEFVPEMKDYPDLSYVLQTRLKSLRDGISVPKTPRWPRR